MNAKADSKTSAVCYNKIHDNAKCMWAPSNSTGATKSTLSHTGFDRRSDAYCLMLQLCFQVEKQVPAGCSNIYANVIQAAYM